MTHFSGYNIDALRNEDGTYRTAHAKIIRGALNTNHTCHLQTERGVIAFRSYKIKEVRINKRTGEPYFPGEKAGKNWLIEFYPTGGNREDEVKLYTPYLEEALAFAYKHLNGKPHKYNAGRPTKWYSNQAERDAEVLAVIDDEVLIEYEMPGTTNGRETSALVLCRGAADKLYHVRNYPHRKLPKRWVQAMHEQGTTDWIGLGQRESDYVPFPTI